MKTKFGNNYLRPAIKSRYFLLKKDRKIEKLFANKALCIKELKIPEKSIRNGVSLNRKQRTRHWDNFNDKSDLWIDVSSIPLKTINRYGIPKSITAIHESLALKKHLHEEQLQDFNLHILKENLISVYQDQFPRFIHFYREEEYDEAQRISYAKTHALFAELIKMKKNCEQPPEVLFHLYREITLNEYIDGHTPGFITESQRYFWRKIKLASQVGISQVLVHALKGSSQGHLIKYNKQHKAFVRNRLRDPLRIPYREIANRFYKKFRFKISLSQVKKMGADLETKNLTSFDSNGLEYSRTNSLPKLPRDLATSPGELFQADFYWLQFYCVNIYGKIIRLIAYVVLDVYSRKVVGWKLFEKIEAQGVIDTYKQIFKECGYIPSEILVDNDPIYKDPKLKEFIQRIKTLECVWTFAKPNQPTWKAEIESFFSKFQKMVCSSDKFYIGEGMGSKNVRGNPAIETVKKLWSKKKDLPTEKELITNFDLMIIKYNESDFYEDKKKPDYSS